MWYRTCRNRFWTELPSCGSDAGAARSCSNCIGVRSWWFDGSILWIAGALLIFAVVPFTLIVILPTNKRLLTTGIDRTARDTQLLLVRWGRLHALRTIASLSASVIFLIAVLKT